MYIWRPGVLGWYVRAPKAGKRMLIQVIGYCVFILMEILRVGPKIMSKYTFALVPGC